MEVGLLCPVAVGLVRWDAPEPQLTAVVKATFLLGGNHPGSVSPAQEPLFVDSPGELGGPDELEHAGDFAPRKARADVLIVGHAQAAKARNALSVSFEVGPLRKQGTAMAGMPCTTIPLSARFLRTGDGSSVRVAPRPVVTTWRSRMAAHFEVTGHREAPFDFGLFNVAPEDQQLAALASGVRLALSGVGRNLAPEVRLPAIEPAVFLVSSRAPGAAGLGIALTCDTLWIHCDRAICTLVWRGDVAAPANEDEAFLVVDMGVGQAPSWQAVEARLGMASWGRAIDEEEVQAEVDRAMAADQTSPSNAAGYYDRAKLTGDVPEVSAKPHLLPRERAATVQIDADVVDADVVDADVEPAPESTQPMPNERRPAVTMGSSNDTVTSAGEGAGAALPFGPGARALPAALAAALEEIDGDGGATVQFDGERSSSRALPFPGASPFPDGEPASTSGVPSRPEGATIDVREAQRLRGQLEAALPFRQQLQGLTGGALGSAPPAPPPPVPPPPRPAVGSVPAANATIPSEMLRKMSADALAAPAPRPPPPPAPRTRPGSSPDSELESYAALRAEIEEAQDPAQALRDLGLTADAWASMRRDWSRRCLADRALAERLRQRLAAARDALRKGSG